ncbi:hypothetical protein LCGC14_2066870, partial [marine sediment metagenome]
MSYVGSTLEVPLGIDGMFGIKRIPITGLLQARNITLENNLIEKLGGATRQNAVALSGGVAAELDWWPDSVTQRFIVVTDDGGVFRDTGPWTFPTTVLAAGTLTIAGQSPHLVEGGNEAPGSNKKLFLFTGNDAVRVGSGDFVAMTTIANPPADWAGARQPRTGAVHQARLWGFLEHTAYFSTPDDHEDFTGVGSGSIPIEPGVGQFISGALPTRLMLIVGKFPRGLFIVNTSDITIANWRYDPQSRAIGPAGPYC